MAGKILAVGCFALVALAGWAETGPFGGENIIANGSFESGTSMSGNVGYGRNNAVSTSAWRIGDNAGLSMPGSWCTPTTMHFVDGTHCAFIQLANPAGSWISQTFTAPQAGVYRLSFYHAARPGTLLGLRLQVFVDDVNVGYATNWSMDFDPSIFDVPLAAGSHTLKFQGDLNGLTGDLSAVIDKVSLEIPAAGPHSLANLDNYGFRFDFSGGTRQLSGSRFADDASHKIVVTSVDGPNGLNTAALPASGWGSIVDGDKSLNGDWSVTMSCMSQNADRKILVSVGGNGTKDRKQLLVCTQTDGRLHFAIGQNWGSGKNVPSSINVGDVHDSDSRFHAVCCVHRKETNIICCYVDGVLAGRLDAVAQSAGRSFMTGFQFAAAHGGGVSGVNGGVAVAFEDFRFFERALSDEEVALYAKTYPARRPSQSPVATDVNPTADTTYPSDPTVDGTLLVPAGVTVTLPSLSGPYFNYGKIVLTGDGTLGAPRGPGVMRFAGSQTLNWTSRGNSPVELAGNVTIAASAAIAAYRSSPITVESGTVTLAGQVNIGDVADADYYDPYGAVINFLGGSFAGPGFFYTGGRRTQIDINIPAGTFTARVSPWGAADSQGHNRRVNVSGTGVFAPSSLAYSGGSAPACVERTTIRLHDGGTFVPPADWPAFAWVEAQSGACTMQLARDAAPQAKIAVDAGAELAVTGAHALDLTKAVASVAGVLAVADGTTLKLNAGTVFDGTLTVAATGKLVIDCAKHDGTLVVLTAQGGIDLGGEVGTLVELVNLPSWLHPVRGEDGKTIRLMADDLTIPVTADWVGAGVAGKLDDPANWTCYNAAGEVLSGAVPMAQTFARVVDVTNFQLPNDPAAMLAAMDGSTAANRMTTICAHIQYATRGDTADYSYMDIPYSAYDPLGEVPLTMLRDETWKARYLGWSQLRFDGWFKVAPEQAGTWKLDQRFDDYYALYFDGVCVLKNKTYTKNESAICTMTAGWHRFTLVVGDTYGGFGLTKSVNGEPTVLGVRINGGEEVAFESAFEQGTGPSRMWNRLAVNSCQLATDCDWRGVASFVDGAVIDLAGHTLTVSALQGAAEITDTVGGGVLIGDFNGLSNTEVAFTGKLRFVKDGPGIFYASKAGQSYTGGTEIRSGKVFFNTTATPLGVKNSEIKIAAGTMLDMNGCVAIYNYDTAGTIRMASSTGSNGWNEGWKCFGPEFKLSGDAKVTGKWFYFGCPDQNPMYFTMNGHTLTFEMDDYVGIGTWRARNAGRMKFVKGAFEWLAGYGPKEIDLEVHSPAQFKLGGNFDMGGLWYDATTWSKNSNVASHLLVYGVWRATTYRPPICLYPNSGIDLNDLTEPLDLSGGDRSCASGANGYVSFNMGEGGTCFIDVSRRRTAGNGTKVIAWSEPPANVNFVLNEESQNRRYWLRSRTDGLWIWRSGITILVR